MSKKNKTAVDLVLSQLGPSSLGDAASVTPVKKSKKKTSLPPIINESTLNHETNDILSLQVEDCILWANKDRKECDLGDLQSLAQDIKDNGQIQPGIVRPIKNEDGKYEVIVGERRFRACKIAQLNFKAISRNVTDQEAAVLQAAENLNRKDLSDYSRGVNYSLLIKNKVFTRNELCEKLKISKAQLSEFLSFSEIPNEILSKITNLSAVSSYVASLIRANSKKGQEYISAIIAICPKISQGIGSNKFNLYLKQEMGLVHEKQNLSKKVQGTNDRHLFTMKNNGKIISSVQFPKDIASIINFEQLEQKIREEIERQVENIENAGD